MKILVSAGEASSDLYGAQLIIALRRRARAEDEPLEFMGVGGERMRAAGCDTVIDSRHLSVVGMTEILGHLPKIYSEFHKLLRVVDDSPTKPELAVVIDSPAFNFRVAREMHKRGVPVIYFVAPQLWAWREYRVKRMQRWVKKVLCIFPFEEDFYRMHNVEVEYVGHPLADLPLPAISRKEFARQNNLDSAATWIALLPGSRMSEVKATVADMLRGAKLIAPQLQEAQFILPVAPSLNRAAFDRELAGEQGNASVKVFPVADSRVALFHSRAAVVASGTATVEAALMGCPIVAVYRLSPLTFWAARRLVKVPHVAMPNLIAGRQIVPELLQNEFTPQNVARELAKIVPDGPSREQMLHGLAEVTNKLRFAALGRTNQTSAVERAADAVMKTLSPETARRPD